MKQKIQNYGKIIDIFVKHKFSLNVIYILKNELQTDDSG